MYSYNIIENPEIKGGACSVPVIVKEIGRGDQS